MEFQREKNFPKKYSMFQQNQRKKIIDIAKLTSYFSKGIAILYFLRGPQSSTTVMEKLLFKLFMPLNKLYKYIYYIIALYIIYI